MRAVNVAQVKHRSPFRYPGGKTWLVPYIQKWISTHEQHLDVFIEPFAGGGIVGLTVAFEQLAEQVILVELDQRVSAVWRAIIEEGQGEWLAQQIEAFDCTQENVERILYQEGELSLRDLAFQTIVHNRTSRSGIIAEGSGLLKEGENGNGIASRWYAATLAGRIREIDQIRERLTIIAGDGLEVIEAHTTEPNTMFFVDPPYTAGSKQAGQRLYDHWDLDHTLLFDTVNAVQGPFLMTYENDPTVRALAQQYNFDTRTIMMKNSHHSKTTELLIGRDLTWLRSAP